jgi:hypothetical protein
VSGFRIGRPALGCETPRHPLALALFLALSPWLPAAQGSDQAAQDPVAAPGNPNAQLKPEVQDKLDRWIPGTDEWVGEGLSQDAQNQFSAWVKTWTLGDTLSAGDLAALLAEDFTTTPLRPSALETVFDDGVFLVHRLSEQLTEGAADVEARQGREGMAAAMDELLQPFSRAEDFHAKLKIFRFEEKDGLLVTQAYYFAHGSDGSRRIQQKATWHCDWQLAEQEAPRLLSVRVDDFEEVRGPVDGQTLFADCTESLFGEDDSFETQLLPSMGYWQGRLDRGLGFSDQTHQGVAIGDVNGDGLEDLFLPQPGGLPNRLYLHQADGTLLDHSVAAGIDFLDATRCALLLDLDNDGDLDLVMNLGPDLVFFSNDGSGKFAVEASGPAPEATMIAAADYDNDGFLDIYVCRYLNPYEDQAVPTPYHDANNGLDNILLRCTEDWQIQDVTEAVGLNTNNQRFSFAASWEDYDNDGDQDLYVANDFGRNNLYRNDGGQFQDVAAEAGVEDISAGMGVSWGDFDRDGWMDIYVSNMYSSAGNRVAYQRDFLASAGDRTIGDVRRHARGNSLFRNLGDGTFRDVTMKQEVYRGLWAWGSIFVDLNNDAWLDLVVPNGFSTNDRKDDL